MRLRFSPLLIALAAGCVEDVTIAGECPPEYVGPCLVELIDGGDVAPPPQDPAPMARVDAGLPQEAAAPAPQEDAAVVVPSLPFPAIENRSFEFSNANSVAGDVTTLSLLTMTEIDPWYTCQPIGGQIANSVTAVRAETGLAAGDREGTPKVNVGPKDGETFVTIGYLVNVVPVPLLQRLQSPVRAGTRYAFAIDALATSEKAKLSLEVRGNEQGCSVSQPERTLYKSPPITSLDWTTVCVSFSAPADLSYLFLAAEPNPDSVLDPAEMLIEGDILGGPRLIFDRIREASPKDCPELF